MNKKKSFDPDPDIFFVNKVPDQKVLGQKS
jgi:hypothetical protein